MNEIQLTPEIRKFLNGVSDCGFTCHITKFEDGTLAIIYDTNCDVLARGEIEDVMEWFNKLTHEIEKHVRPDGSFISAIVCFFLTIISVLVINFHPLMQQSRFAYYLLSAVVFLTFLTGVCFTFRYFKTKNQK